MATYPRSSDFHLPGPGHFSVQVVGESYYQDNLIKICGEPDEEGYDDEVIAILFLDDGNPHDSQAVKVCIDGLVVGHLDRTTAREYRQQLVAAGHPKINAECDAVIRGGWDRGAGDKGKFGVWLDLPTDADSDFTKEYTAGNPATSSASRPNRARAQSQPSQSTYRWPKDDPPAQVKNTSNGCFSAMLLLLSLLIAAALQQ